MSRTKMTATIVLTILAVIWIVRQINNFAGRVVLNRGDIVEISGETWFVHKSPRLAGPWLRHRLVNQGGREKTIHVVDMGRLFRDGEAKLICQKGDPGWQKLATQFKIE